MRIRTILLVAALYAVPVCAQQTGKTECRSLDGSNPFVGPDEVIVPASNGYQIYGNIQEKTKVEAATKTQDPAQRENAPVVTDPTGQADSQEGNIPVRNFADINDEDAVRACISNLSRKVVSTQTGSTLNCSDWLAMRAAKLYQGSATPRAAVQPTSEVIARPEPQQTKRSSVKTVSFAVADHNGGIEYYVPNWVQKWIKKNAKKHPDILFTQEKSVENNSYLVVLSDSAHALSGFEPVTHTSTSTSTSPVSGSGTVTDYNGDRWNYTYDGTVTTTTTTRTTQNEAYTIDSSTLYATTFDSRGGTVSQHWHEYSTKSGGDAYNSLGYNLGNALAAINARGRLLSAAMKDIQGPKQKKH
jgi:hypothetical protein